ELGVDAGEEVGDVEWGAGLLKYVESHVYLRQTLSLTRLGRGRSRLTEAADRAELGLQRGLKHGENHIFHVIIHGGLLSQRLRIRMTCLCRSVHINLHIPTCLRVLSARQ